jgi:hypothetical protein
MSEQHPSTESELVELIRASDMRAPDRLHHTVESLIAARPSSARHRASAERTRSTGRPRLGLGLGLAGTLAIAAVAAVAIALAVGLSGGGGTVSLRRASALTLSPATMPAPAESAGNNGQLAVAVDGVSFPYWEGHFGWRSTGARRDQLDGRTVTTVFYEDAGGRRIGYSIVAGTPAPSISGGGAAWRSGVRYRLVSENGNQMISWLRDGHLCVVSGRGVSAATLLALASWTARGSVAS